MGAVNSIPDKKFYNGIKINLKHESIDYLNESFSNSQSSFFNKSYYVPIEDKDDIIIYIINIKKIEDKMYLYLHNLFTNDNRLIHVFDTDNSIESLEKYVQISPDLKLLSIPDGKFLYIFKVDKLINNNTLDQVDFDIKFDISGEISCISLKSKDNSFESSSSGLHLYNPSKCVLYLNKFIFINNGSKNTNKGISIFDFTQKKSKTVKLPHDNNLSTVLSDNGKYLLLYDQNCGHILNCVSEESKQIKLCDEKSDKVKLNTATISSTGNVVTFLTETQKVKIFCFNEENKYNVSQFDICENIGNLKHITSHLYDFVDLLPKNCLYNSLHLLMLWNKSTHSVYIWSITCCGNNKTISYGPQKIHFDIKNDVQSLCVNNNIFTYKYPTFIEIYDVNKHFPIILLNTLLDTSKYMIKIKMLPNKNIRQNNVLKIITPKTVVTLNVKDWIGELCGNELNLFHCENIDTDIFKYEDNNINLLDVFFGLFQNHYTINNYVSHIKNGKVQKNKLDTVLNLIIQISKIIKKKVTENQICSNDILYALEYYTECLIIKFILTYYEHRCVQKDKIVNILSEEEKITSNSQSNKYNKTLDIKNIATFFNKLKVARMVMLKSCKMMFGFDLTEII